MANAGGIAMPKKGFQMKNIYTNLETQFNKVFRHLKVCSFKTRERYAKAFKRFMIYLAKEYRLQKLSNISEKHILSYLNYLQKKGLAASTIKTELAAIRFFHDNLPYVKYTLPTNDALETGRLLVKGKGGLTRYVPINRSIEIVLTNSIKGVRRGEKLFVRNDDKTHLAMKRLQCFIAYHRKEFTENQITFHGLRHTYAHEKYKEFISIGKNEKEARRMVSELLGHHRDDVTRIYLAGGDEDV